MVGELPPEGLAKPKSADRFPPGRAAGWLPASGRRAGSPPNAGILDTKQDDASDEGRLAKMPRGIVERWRSRPVSRVLFGACAPRQSFLWDRGYPRPLATYPGAARATPLPPYLVLHRMGFADPGRYRRGSALLPTTRLTAPSARPPTHGTISTLPSAAWSSALLEVTCRHPLAQIAMASGRWRCLSVALIRRLATPGR